MKVYDEVPPPEYITIEDAVTITGRSARTIYDWIKIDGLRTFKRRNQPTLVNYNDIMRIERIRAQGRRRKPRPPTL